MAPVQVTYSILGPLCSSRLLVGPPFKPVSSASLIHLSIKLAFPLAVATSRHGSELKALSINSGQMS